MVPSAVLVSPQGIHCLRFLDFCCFFLPGTKKISISETPPLLPEFWNSKDMEMFIMKCLLGTCRIVQMLKLMSNVWLEWRNTKDTKRYRLANSMSNNLVEVCSGFWDSGWSVVSKHCEIEPLLRLRWAFKKQCVWKSTNVYLNPTAIIP